MGLYFFDSRALVKNYVAKTGSIWVQTTLNATDTNAVYAVSVTKVEVISAVLRRAKGGSISPDEALQATYEFKFDFENEFRKIDIDDHLVEKAIDLTEKYNLRGYDAIQLAAAQGLFNEILSSGQRICVCFFRSRIEFSG